MLLLLFKIEILSAKDSKSLGFCTVKPEQTIAELRSLIHKQCKKAPHSDRQSLRLNPKGKALKDSDTLQSLDVRNGSKVYVKDLGPQIGWKTVFLAEYAGPLAVYLWIYQRPSIFYSDSSAVISSTTQ